MDGKKLTITAISIIVAVGVIFLAFKAFNQTPIPQPTPITTTPSIIETPTSSTSATTTNQLQEFTVTGSNYKFEPATLTVNQGDKVKITFKNSGGIHDFTIEEFNVKTKAINSGASETVEFTADKTGSFEYYCGVGNHRQMGMKGTLIIQ